MKSLYPKSILFLVVALFFAQSSSASTSSASEERNVNRVLKCVRAITESHRFNTEVILKTDGLLRELSSDYGNHQDTSALMSDCQALKKESEKIEKQTDSQIGKLTDDLYWQGKGLISDIFADIVLKRFLSPSMACHIVGIEVKAALGFGLGAGLATGTCRSDTGRRFAVMVPMGAVLLGGIVEAEMMGLSFEIPNAHNVLDESSITLALGVSVRMDQLGILGGSSKTEGLGVGLGFALEDYAVLPLKFLPLGNNFKAIKALLKNETVLN